MAKLKRTIFIVSGSGYFPVDMLRYDSCWPTTNDSVIDLHIFRDDPEFERTRQIELATDRVGGPTEGRWMSFGWKVLTMRSV